MSKRIADSFRRDRRVAQAKKLIMEALKEHSDDIVGVRPPDEGLTPAYGKLLETATKSRGQALYFPYLGSGIGRGALVELGDGSVKFDLISGIGVHVLGHSHPLLIEAALDAALGDTVMQGNLQQNEEPVEVARLLLEVANKKGARLAHCFLTTSGAMANENALKLLFQKQHPATRVLAFEDCFAGRTLALSQVTAREDFRVGLPPTISVDRVPFFDASNPVGSTERALNALQDCLQRHPGEYATMVFELVQGERGAYPGDTNFFRALMSKLGEFGVPIMIDEIQTFGRTHELFAFQHFGLDQFADVVTVGKLLQLCATLYKAELNPKPGLLSQTFSGATGAIHAARAILRELSTGDYFGSAGKIQRINAAFTKRLEALAKRTNGALCGPYGIGSMVGFTVFDGDSTRTKKFVRELFDAGVIAFIAGGAPLRVRFLLPYPVLTTADIDRIVEIMEATLVKQTAQ